MQQEAAQCLCAPKNVKLIAEGKKGQKTKGTFFSRHGTRQGLGPKEGQERQRVQAPGSNTRRRNRHRAHQEKVVEGRQVDW